MVMINGFCVDVRAVNTGQSNLTRSTKVRGGRNEHDTKVKNVNDEHTHRSRSMKQALGNEACAHGCASALSGCMVSEPHCVVFHCARGCVGVWCRVPSSCSDVRGGDGCGGG